MTFRDVEQILQISNAADVAPDQRQIVE
jgi:hypothetical protein